MNLFTFLRCNPWPTSCFPEVFWVWFSLLPGCSVLWILLDVCHPVLYWWFLYFSKTELKCRDLTRVISIPSRNATLFSTVEIFQRLVYTDLSSLDLAYSRHSENDFMSWFLSWVFCSVNWRSRFPSPPLLLFFFILPDLGSFLVSVLSHYLLLPIAFSTSASQDSLRLTSFTDRTHCAPKFPLKQSLTI